jgi:hypothetical protein
MTEAGPTIIAHHAFFDGVVCWRNQDSQFLFGESRKISDLKPVSS